MPGVRRTCWQHLPLCESVVWSVVCPAAATVDQILLRPQRPVDQFAETLTDPALSRLQPRPFTALPTFSLAFHFLVLNWLIHKLIQITKVRQFQLIKKIMFPGNVFYT